MLRFHLTSEKGLFTSQNQADDNCNRHLFVWNILEGMSEFLLLGWVTD